MERERGDQEQKSGVREKGGTRLREDERNKYKTRERERESCYAFVDTWPYCVE